MLKNNLISTVFSALVIPIIFLYGLYIQFHGELSPGGGFQAGVISACAIILYSLTLNQRRILFLKFILCSGVTLYLITGLLCILNGGMFLEYGAVFGQHIGIFVVEIGIYLTVFASILIIYFSFRDGAFDK